MDVQEDKEGLFCEEERVSKLYFLTIILTTQIWKNTRVKIHWLAKLFYLLGGDSVWDVMNSNVLLLWFPCGFKIF